MIDRKLQFTVDVLLFEDGTLVATSKDISGLVLEVRSFDELREELLKICPILLIENHGIRNSEIQNVLIKADVRREEIQMTPRSERNYPALVIQEILEPSMMHV